MLPNGVAAMGIQSPVGQVVLVADGLTKFERCAARIITYALLAEHIAVIIKVTTLARIIEDAA